MPAVAPYGSWPSPISAAMVAEAGVRLSAPWFAGEALYWLEGRPAEGGRVVLVRRDPAGEIADATPPGFNVRTRVHEYGGGAFTVHGATVFFSNFEDQRLYRQDGPGEAPRPITPEPPAPASVRYADGRVTPDGRLLVCVRERHEPHGVVNELVALPVDGSAEPRVLAGGHDFFSSARPSPDGRFLAWMSWDHPRMPWDGTELWVAELSPEGSLGQPRLVAGGPEESVFQPEWSSEGLLHFVSDRTGWWNLYREAGDAVEPLCPMEAEFGLPQWAFDLSRYAFLADGRIACVYGRDGIDHVGVLDPRGGDLREVSLPYAACWYLRARDGALAMVAAGPTEADAVVLHDLDTGATDVLRRSLDVELDPGYVSVPRPIEFPTERGLTAHALFYPPANPGLAGPPDERPPLLVLSHGGPTAHAGAELVLETQFWTSRGFAVVDVNYGGSTGFGRAYRERLRGMWGVVDVEDCVNAARYLAEGAEVDGTRLAIRGWSAGGYTTLAALTSRDDFAAGASHFGVADVQALARDTHKFESRYIEGLVPPELYGERSPIHHVDRLSTPVILLQGLEDPVVPPAQAELMVEELARKGIPHAYVAFEGEQHGFRRAENIRRAAEAELYFYGRIFGFEPADDIEPVRIEGLAP